jgi:hypothetical protein
MPLPLVPIIASIGGAIARAGASAVLRAGAGAAARGVAGQVAKTAATGAVKTGAGAAAKTGGTLASRATNAASMLPTGGEHLDEKNPWIVAAKRAANSGTWQGWSK